MNKKQGKYQENMSQNSKRMKEKQKAMMNTRNCSLKRKPKQLKKRNIQHYNTINK